MLCRDLAMSGTRNQHENPGGWSWTILPSARPVCHGGAHRPTQPRTELDRIRRQTQPHSWFLRRVRCRDVASVDPRSRPASPGRSTPSLSVAPVCAPQSHRGSGVSSRRSSGTWSRSIASKLRRCATERLKFYWRRHPFIAGHIHLTAADTRLPVRMFSSACRSMRRTPYDEVMMLCPSQTTLIAFALGEMQSSSVVKIAPV